jgi:hypothetical protein
MSTRQEFLTEIAVSLNEMAASGFTDITVERLARHFCRRSVVGDGMPAEISQYHNEIIRIAHGLASHLDWMPTTKVYFVEKLYAREEVEERDVIRAVCLGGGKICHGFRLARGTHDPYSHRWTDHGHHVRAGVESKTDKKTFRLAGNAHLPQIEATKMITTARHKGLNCTDYPIYFHFYKDKDPADPFHKSSWISPGSTIWYGDKNAVALFIPGMDKMRMNLVSFDAEFRYMTEKKYKSIDPKITIRVVQEAYSQLIYAIFRKTPGKTSLATEELNAAAKEVDIDGVIYQMMLKHQKPPTNLLKDEDE